MRCEELREWLSADLDGEASAAEQVAVEEHLAVCGDCRRAQAAAEALRGGLSLATSAAVASESDAALLAVLRAEGLFRTDSQPRRHEAHEGARLLAGWLVAAARVSGPALEYCRSLCSSYLCGFHPAQYRSLQLAAGLTALSFLATWGALRWAETGRGATPGTPAVRSAATMQRLPMGDEMLDEWMAGTPSMAALERLQRLPPAAPPAPAAVRRGAAVVGERRRVG